MRKRDRELIRSHSQFISIKQRDKKRAKEKWIYNKLSQPRTLFNVIKAHRHTQLRCALTRNKHKNTLIRKNVAYTQRRETYIVLYMSVCIPHTHTCIYVCIVYMYTHQNIHICVHYFRSNSMRCQMKISENHKTNDLFRRLQMNMKRAGASERARKKQKKNADLQSAFFFSFPIATKNFIYMHVVGVCVCAEHHLNCEISTIVLRTYFSLSLLKFDRAHINRF